MQRCKVLHYNKLNLFDVFDYNFIMTDKNKKSPDGLRSLTLRFLITQVQVLLYNYKPLINLSLTKL